MKTPTLVFLLLTFALALFYMTADWPEIRVFLQRQVPAPMRERARMMKQDVGRALRQWAAAQLKLMGITFMELSLAFFFLRVEYSMLLAAAVSLVDALPLLGTGTVLLPWALGSLLLGETRRAVFLAVTWALVSLVRSLLEPRFIGSRSGLHPAATLFALFCGARLAGVWGMLLFPPGLLVLKQLNDRQWIRLWR
jgi:sporulation integral membrane protein YtvI